MGTFVKKGVTYKSPTGELVSCLFCRIHARTEPGQIVYEDSQFVAFRTIQPSTPSHLLITPRQHIANLRSISGAGGAKLVEDLVQVGKLSLGDKAEGATFCFHVPPFNSIDHLHLHAIGETSQWSWLSYLKYGVNSVYCQTAQDVILRLRNESSIGDGEDIS